MERKRYLFKPDYRNIVSAARNHPASRLPLYEQHFGYQIMKDMTGLTPYDTIYSKDMKESKEGFRQLWAFYRQIGFDVVCHDFWLVNILEGGGALGGHQDGCIKNREDFDRYPWRNISERYFNFFSPYLHNFIETCPPDMMAVGGIGNGLFEALQDIVGYVNLCYIRADDEELYHDLFRAMGNVQIEIWERFMLRFSHVFCAMRFCDDMGLKHQTLINPVDIRRCIIPVYQRISGIVHHYNKPIILHSCGYIEAIMDDLINIAQIDAKHSNEDQIAPFTDWVFRYGNRIGNFGGLDVGVLVSETPENIRKMTLECLEQIQGHGGVAFSSGSSVPDYVPADNYLAMNEAVRDWRGDKQVLRFSHQS